MDKSLILYENGYYQDSVFNLHLITLSCNLQYNIFFIKIFNFLLLVKVVCKYNP